MTSSTAWADLPLRLASAVILLLVCGFALWSGDLVFTLLLTAILFVMHWELAHMLTPMSKQVGAVSGTIAVLTLILVLRNPDSVKGIIYLGLGVACQVSLYFRLKWQGAVASVCIFMTVFYLVALRASSGLEMILWLISIVVLTDVLGYFAGRVIKGPKFWPSVSPKKTWSGILAGWLASGICGWFWVSYGFLPLSAGFAIFFSVTLAFASQIGDIGESALKRGADQKDSSSLLPGHGGFLDRFDGLVGATIVFASANMFMSFG
ncbi:phosphatidate cytidylyltransferase [Paracoccaceae bacterium]|nr:phosphatidate cytidylyltransferase [Paracoccaceae bacterium]